MILTEPAYIEPKHATSKAHRDSVSDEGNDWGVGACKQEAGSEGSADEPDSMDEILEKIDMIKRKGFIT